MADKYLHRCLDCGVHYSANLIEELQVEKLLCLVKLNELTNSKVSQLIFSVSKSDG